MRRQLSRLESEYVLSNVAASKPPLEISVMPSPKNGASGAPVSAAVCRPQFYSFDLQSRRFFFDEAFISESKLPRGVQCLFCFFYKTRRVCFSAAISSIESRSFCRAEALFYADEESPFLPSASGKVLLSGDALSGALSVRVRKDFPLDTTDRNERMMSFSKFANSESGAALFAAEALENFAPGGTSGVLFYLDHKGALACFPIAAAASLFPHDEREGAMQEPANRPANYAALAEKIRTLKGAAQRGSFCMELGLRKIEAECGVFFSVSRGSLLFCSLAFAELAPENVRFLYEMSRGEKYTGSDLPE